MAIEERKTKAERRAEARAQRQAAEQEARKQAQRRSFVGGVGAVVAIGLVGLGGYFLLDNLDVIGGSGEEAEMTISRAAALDARGTAGCEMLVDNQPLPEATHHDPASAPSADQLYAASTVRPTHSGSHFNATSGGFGGIPNNVDERALTHNLEHGAVIVWFDPAQAEGGTQDAMENWMQDRQSLGFTSRAGGNVFVAPYEDISSGKAIAIRAWGYALDCDSWDATVADSFLIDYYGTHGSAPERPLSPYPAGALGYADTTVEDNTEAPTEADHDNAEDPDDGGSSEDEPADGDTG